MKTGIRRVALSSLLSIGGCSAPSSPATTTVSPPADGGTTTLSPASDAAAPLPPLPIANGGVLLAGNARFTVITQTLIRIEYDQAKKFVDAPTYFAANREQRYRYATLSYAGKRAHIDTGAMTLTYTDDGKPFSTTNLEATVLIDGVATHVVPLAPDTQNLGGTTATLDNWDGANRLDDGIVSRAGYHLVDDTNAYVLVDGWVKERSNAEVDDYLFGYGHDYRAAIASLTAIGGPVPMPRRNVLGAWFSRYWPYSTADFEGIVQEYKDHDFPLDNVVLDMDWHNDGWTGWSWNRSLIPDPAALMAFFHGHGLESTVNIHPADGVAKAEDAYPAFMSAMGQDPKSGVTIPFDAGNQKYMDALFSTVHQPLEDVGVDFFWLDWQQTPSTVSFPRLGNIPWLNELYTRHTGAKGRRGVSFSRWGGLGDHRHPIHFSGDAATSFEMLAFEIPFTSTSGNSGLFFWTHDIGGHHNGRNEESYTRWCQFGALSAALRPHSTRDATLDRRPWTYPDWALHSMQVSWQLRSKLFPYLYSAVWQSTQTSVPFLRPMYFDEPQREDAYHQPQEYFLGDALLAAPVAEAGAGALRLGRQAVWFPAGTFYDYATGERYDGPGEHLVARTIDEVPLFARAGVPIATQAFTPRMATTATGELVVRCYPGADGVLGRSTFHEDDGRTVAYQSGNFGSTTLECTTHGGEVDVRIAPTDGTFDGQLATRSYVIEIPTTAAATAAFVDGQTAAVAYTASDRTNRVHVDARSIRQGASVRIVAAPASAEDVRKTAFAARVALDPKSGAIADLAKSAYARAGSDAERLAVLAAAGSGVYPKNGNIYGYPAKASLTAYQEPWLNVTSSVTTVWQGVAQLQTGTVSFAGSTITVPGLVVAFDFDHPGTDLAHLATATFSSTEQASTIGVADKVVGGYPGDRAQEWSSKGETAGAWVKLSWPTAQTIGSVVLFDRINPNDQITSGTLTFDDGSTVAVGALANDPSTGGNTVHFAAKTTKSLTFTVTAVSATTENVGLAELAAYAP